MSAWWTRFSAVALLGAGVALLVPACADNESSLFVRACMFVTRDTCSATADPSAAVLGEGRFDTFPQQNGNGGADHYTCLALFGNQLVQRGNSQKLATETSRIFVYSADVTVLDGGGNVITRADGSPAQFTTPVNGFADPGTGSIPGYGLALIQMIDSQTLHDLAPPPAAVKPGKPVPPPAPPITVVASVVVHGRTLGGLEETSAPFQFPITVCRGCLCTQPPNIPCVGGMDKPEPNCEVGQDNLIDCRYLGQNCPAR